MKDLFGDNIREPEIVRGAEYAGIVVHETDDAVLFFFGDGECWLPKSRVAIHSKGRLMRTPLGRPGAEAVITIPDSLAAAKGLLE